ncbi:RagB/SusD family nutrient uptake outer membrane protein [Lacinutrix sp. Hel_I_90]|uniref:RagB/SusD family nutrient uptake outer membrane protein n=1 Tax=Lacinutrix sp. Hel_I_90 TaxID=1249999 RepID=UPI0018CD6405|nr:RagB/SusD family nutrient uptake outer membrane protein [Lacinutrix sp. Hel_I_90]
MKTIYNLFIILFSLTIVSCEDSVNFEQPGEIPAENTFNSVADLQLGLNDVYYGLNTDEAIQISSFFTDETALGFENGGQNVELLQFQLNAVSEIPTNLWLNNYRTINRVNRIIEAGNLLTVTEEEEAEFNDILAQLYTIRAAEYFELLSYFSTDLTDDNALGVMKIDRVPSTSEEFPRVSNGEIFDFINSDLSFAKENLDATRTNSIYITSYFITALEARMALYRGDYPLSNTKAQALIDVFPLASRIEYFEFFQDANRIESIFTGDRNISNGAAISGNFYFSSPGINGGPFMELGRALFNQLDPTDIRYNMIVQFQSEIDPSYDTNGGVNDILLIGKYPGSDGSTVNDYKYFRISEMYLIKAEAQARTDFTTAAQTLKELRDARSLNTTVLDTYANSEEALTAVLKERRIELAFEGHRYLDLKRLSPSGIDRDPVDCLPLNACTLNTNEFYKYTFPIPQSEIAGNSAISGQQNPGY